MKKLLAFILVLISIPLAFCAETSNNPIFSHRIGVYFSPNPGGFELNIYGDGSIVYEEYIINDMRLEEVVKREEYKISEEYAQELLALIKQGNIGDIPEYIPTYILDAPSHSFNFNGKTIHAEGIEKTSGIELLKLIIYPEYFASSLYQNRVLELFDNIANVLGRAGYDMALYSFNLSED